MEEAKYAMNIKEEKGRQNQMIENRLKAERPRVVTEKATKGDVYKRQPLTKIKDNWVAEFVDSEGNHIEMTAPV